MKDERDEKAISERNFGHALKAATTPEGMLDPRVYRAAVASGRIFKLDRKASEVVSGLALNHGALIDSMSPWAKPPFENMILDFMLWDDGSHQRATQFALVVSNGMAWMHYWKPGMEPGNFVLHQSGMIQRNNRFTTVPVLPDADTGPQGELVKMWLLFGAFCLLLHAPKGVQITEKPAHRKLVRGKQKAYAAHSVITIDLSVKEARRVVADGSRGPVRAHEVRGHWMHLNRVRGCSHDWRAVPVEPDRPERYVCDCGTVRVWRKAHQKGDATLGYVTHEYRVTHGDHA